jgi:RNA polymerase sigma-70 factor (ECF subfamily)
MTEPLNQDELLKKATEGDQSALEQLLMSHYDDLARHIEPRIGAQMRSVVGVDDVLQETFVQAFRDISKFQTRSGSSFRGWLKAIAENRLMDAIKSWQRKKRGGDFHRMGAGDAYRTSVGEFVAVLEDEADSPSRVAAKDEAIDAMEIAIAGLPEDQRQAIQLRCLEGKSLEETAREMDKTVAAVRALIHRAKQALHASMYRTSIWLTKR